ncbi:Signal peptidase I W [Nocardioides dokdonensis FR1436]|uniref:Signal peptidase I n=1 Tax=Nocardioides dokdonensis FR1436 TaxID=1300347 RepID=A0A1A9GP16_9ACTN|nr:signal peptidase I [Nocardioides dokdonensis]ANH39211.1 Signal peptidase I W [Nocardioides dokdonensis FR1436]
MSSPAVPLVVGRHRATAAAPRVFVPAPAPVTAPAPAPEGRRPRRRVLRVLRGLVRVVTSLLVIAALAFFLFFAVGPHVLGYRTATMLTGSMEPGIMVGDVVVTAPRPAEDVVVGDVITYHIPIEDQRVETHRVVEVERGKDGSIAVRTKGDNNDGVDPWTATLDGDTVWEVQAVIPKVGTAIRALRTPVVNDLVLYGALGTVLLLGLSRIWARDEDDAETDEA